MQTDLSREDARFVSWIEQYEKLVFSICYRMTGNYFDAQDLTQETFLSVYKSMEDFDGVNVGGFLTRIATNKCLDYLKKAQRRENPTEEEILHQNASTVPPPEKGVLAREVQKQVQEACNSLKAPYDTIATEYYVQGKKAVQIAQEHGKKLKTIQTQIRRAKGMLQKKIRKEDLL